jgi:hypothetical protein
MNASSVVPRRPVVKRDVIGAIDAVVGCDQPNVIIMMIGLSTNVRIMMITTRNMSQKTQDGDAMDVYLRRKT